MSNDAFGKFGYPEALIKEYNNWILLCAARQATLGSLLLVCKENVSAFSKVSSTGFAELHQVVQETESNLQKLFRNDKINYIMLMMGNPEVHFYIVPRYASEREFAGVVFGDKGWPSKPDTDFAHEVSDKVFSELVSAMRTAFSNT